MVNGVKVGSTIIPVVDIKMAGSKFVLSSLFDNCSQTSFILNSVARKHKLKGKLVSFVLVTTDGNKTKKVSNLYKIRLEDIYGNIHEVEAIGLDEISSTVSGAEVIKVKDKLKANPECKDLTNRKLSRTGGQVQMLIGTDVASIHPVKVASIKELIIMKTVFGSGWTMMGHSDKHVRLKKPQSELKINVTSIESIANVGCNIVKTKDLEFVEKPYTLNLKIQIPATPFFSLLVLLIFLLSLALIPNSFNTEDCPCPMFQSGNKHTKEVFIHGPADTDNDKGDIDKNLRKVTIEYRVSQKCQAIEYKPSVFRYTERNVRDPALLVAAEDKGKTENINVDDLGHLIGNSETSDQEDDPNVSDTVDDSTKDNDSNNINTSNKNALQALIPSSTGRRRFQPMKLSD